MSAKAKKSLGTVVECSENGEEAPESAPARQNGAAKSREKAKRRATFGGSRLSLHTLLFSSNRDKEKNPEKMSRSANDLHVTVSEDEGEGEGEGGEQASGWSGSVGPHTPPIGRSKTKTKECPLCYVRQPITNFPKLTCCSHRSCRSCLVQYLQVEILESRVMVSCPECSEYLHPTDIHSLMASQPQTIDKYESFSLRRVLMTDPDTRWCPAPDCGYAVIASGCAACPELQCKRPGCGAQFCYHCKMVWHPNQTCDEARRQRGSYVTTQMSLDSSLRPGDIKACPRCHTYIVKMNDGSCNHMVCALCGAEFCWLCLKEISDLHYLSPTGCTFWGKKPWTRKKKLLWQLGTLIGAPVGIALIAGLAIPGIVFGVPVFVGRKVHQRLRNKSKIRRRLLTATSVVGSLVVSPVLAVMAVGVGVPILLAYVYGVVPLSLCRNGGCGVSASSSGLKLDDLDDDDIWRMTGGLSDNQEKSRLLRNADDRLLDGTSMVTGASIHSGSSVGISSQQNRLQVQAEMCRRRPSVESGATSLGERFNYEEASTKAMAGSTYCDDKSVHTVCSAQEAVSYCEEVASTKACAGSVADAKSIGGGDSASLRVCTGSIGPDNASGRHVVHNDRGSPAPLLEEDSCDDNSGDQQDEGPSTSNAPLSGNCKTHRRQRAMSSVSFGRQSIELFEPIDGYELPVDDLPSTSHSSKNHHRRALLMSSDGDEGEFLLLSDDTFRQLHPSMKAINVRGRAVELTEPKKSRSVSMLLDSPSDLRQLLLTSTTDPWTVLRSIKSGRQADTSDKKTANAGSKVASYSSLPEDVITVEPVESDSPRRKGLLPKFLARRKR